MKQVKRRHEYITMMIREMEIRVEEAIKEEIGLYRDELNLMPSEIIRRIMDRFNLQKMKQRNTSKKRPGCSWFECFLCDEI